MAKKQTIILTHGSSIPSNGIISGMTLGEVLVQHGTGATNTMLHTVCQTGDTNENVLVSFPSTKWVEEQISTVNVNDAVAAIRQDIQDIDNKINEYSGKTDSVISGISESISELQTKDIEIDGRIDALDEELSGTTNQLAALSQTVADNLNTATGYTDEQVDLLRQDVTANTSDIEAIENKLSGISTTVVDYVTGITDSLNTNIEALGTSKLDKSVYEEKIASVDASLSALTDVVSGYTGVSAIKTAVDSKVDQSVYNQKTEELSNSITALQTTVGEIDAKYVDNDELNAVQTALTASIAAAKTSIVTGSPQVGIAVSVATGTNNESVYTISANGLAAESSVEAVSTRLDNLVSGDNGSIRQIAIQVLSEQLLSGGTEGTMAGESFTTLKELAKWLEEHPDSAAAMNADIDELEKTLTGFSSGNTVSSVTSDINSRLSALSTKVDGIESDYVTKSEKQDILDTISSLETGVTNSIEEINNKFNGITADTINEFVTGITSSLDSRTSALETSLGELETEVENLDKILAESTSELDKKVAAAKTSIVTGSPQVGIAVSATTEENGSTVYTIWQNGLAEESSVNALSTRLETLVNEDIKELKDFMDETPNVYATIESLQNLNASFTATTNEINTTLSGKTDQSDFDALSEKVSTIEGSYLTDIEVENSANNKISATTENHVIKLNFDNMIIDGGEY